MSQQNTPARWTIADTNVGPVLILVGENGVRNICLHATDPAALATNIDAEAIRDDAALEPVARAVAELAAGRRVDFPFPLDLQQGTDFQRSVWLDLSSLPRNMTTSYAALARRVGRPKASRAVGNAVGANPLPIVIPCHRVLTSDGRLGGYTGGLDVKRRLLNVEGHLANVKGERNV
jgi:methylated-DNA-[protein]-cysteine S-methyltransferase